MARAKVERSPRLIGLCDFVQGRKGGHLHLNHGTPARRLPPFPCFLSSSFPSTLPSLFTLLHLIHTPSFPLSIHDDHGAYHSPNHSILLLQPTLSICKETICVTSLLRKLTHSTRRTLRRSHSCPSASCLLHKCPKWSCTLHACQRGGAFETVRYHSIPVRRSGE